MTEDCDQQPVDGEVVTSDPSQTSVDPALNQTLIALVSNYTDRPDLLIGEIEKHDPGFVRRMNASSEAHAEESRRARFRFGKIQAYTALAVSVIAAIALLGALFYAISKGSGFWGLLPIVMFYAVSQGGSSGFAKLIDAMKELISRKKSNDDGDE